MPVRDVHQALKVLNSFEYSSDGFPKRYPDEQDYEEAMKIIASALPSGPSQTADQ